jgi:hypothetical protein
MQSRPVRRLASKMASYARKHSLSDVARKYHVIDPHGRPSRGLVKQIIEGYEPKRPVTRVRIGLPARVHLPRPITINQLMQLPIQDQPPQILRLAFEHREEIES